MKNKKPLIIEETEYKFDILKTKLESSSKTNRNYYLFLISFATYILVVTLSTNDVKILFPELGVHLAILNIDIDLIAYAVLAPLLLTIFYINHLLKLIEHLSLITYYKSSLEKQNFKKEKLFPYIPFIFDFAYLESLSSSQIFKFLNHILTLVYTPLIIFIVVVRFEDFHNSYITLIGWFLFFISISFSIYYIRYLIKKNVASKWLYVLPGFFLLGGIFACLIYRDLIVNDDSFLIQNFATNNEGVKDLKKIDFLISNIVIKPTQKLPLSDIKGYQEYIEVANLFLDSNQLNFNSLPRIDLSGRDLKYAKLSYIFMPFANLEKCNFNYADLDGATLQSANLKKANLQSTYLMNANLRFSDLREANLESAYFWDTNLQSAKLWEANLQFSSFWRVNLESAQLWRANLQFAKLFNTNLQSAKLADANLQSTYLNNVDLQFSELVDANLQSSILDSVNLQSANLMNANLQFSDCNNTDFKYALVSQTNLQNIKNCKMQKALIVEQEVDGVDLKELFAQSYISDFDSYFQDTKNFKDKNNIYDIFTSLASSAKDKLIQQKAKIILLKYVKHWLRQGDIGDMNHHIRIREYSKEFPNILTENEIKKLEIIR